MNTDLIEMYRNIKSHPDEIIYHCKELEKDYYKYDYYGNWIQKKTTNYNMYESYTKQMNYEKNDRFIRYL